MEQLTVGVLALQGDFAKHVEMLALLKVKVQEVRKPEDLRLCEGLIIPGGESTVMLRQIEFIQMREPLLDFAKKHPIFGTCAGLILMAKQVLSFPLKTLQLFDIEVERNAFGTQIDSFRTEITLEAGSAACRQIPAFFIRAPRIRSWGNEVSVLARLAESNLHENEPILIRQGHFLGATFHPELTSCSIVHAYFIGMIQDAKNGLIA